MSNLISGKEALIALANGELVLIRSVAWENFDDLTLDFSLHVFHSNDYEFRLKPKTIMLNGVEVPAPFEPKEGDFVFALSDDEDCGYVGVHFRSHHKTVYGFWEAEEEIKKVVEALLSIFND